jgi:catechol 2,3-dioxygenase-like lactoylglutathione lyase family enzyme
MDPLREPESSLREPQDPLPEPESSLREPREQSPLSVHHVGIAVPSIDDAMHFYGEKLGLSLTDSLELPSTVSRFLERRGPGLHHLCFGTPDIREHLRDLKDKGVELIDEAPRPGAHGEVAFLQPATALGVLVELLQPTEARD